MHLLALRFFLTKSSSRGHWLLPLITKLNLVKCLESGLSALLLLRLQTLALCTTHSHVACQNHYYVKKTTVQEIYEIQVT